MNMRILAMHYMSAAGGESRRLGFAMTSGIIGRRETIAGGLLAAATLASIGARAMPLSLLPEPFRAAPSEGRPLATSALPSGGAALPTWRRFAVTPQPANGRPIICIVIDDLGVMHRGTERIVAMPGPLTLSWFPFAPNLPEQVAGGAARGHEATLHMPMQSFSNSTYQTGPDPLRIDLPPAVNLARLRAAIAAVPNVVGLNNHMGSVATHDAALMELVAHETRQHDMLFLDSLTIGGSQGWRQAEAAGVPSAARDIFIDDKNNARLIAEQLLLIEHSARTRGNVIAIGHPRPLTVDALEAWLPTLPRKGFVLWPLAATVALRGNLPLPGALV